MKYTAHPERRTAFQQAADQLGLKHGLCRRHSPWQNGIIERSHRTDDEEVFRALRFRDSEERRYQLRLFEMCYCYYRRHRGIGGRTPFEVYRSEYRTHAAARMLI